jgi:hypothetical protein
MRHVIILIAGRLNESFENTLINKNYFNKPNGEWLSLPATAKWGERGAEARKGRKTNLVIKRDTPNRSTD